MIVLTPDPDQKDTWIIHAKEADATNSDLLTTPGVLVFPSIEDATKALLGDPPHRSLSIGGTFEGEPRTRRHGYSRRRRYGEYKEGYPPTLRRYPVPLLDEILSEAELLKLLLSYPRLLVSDHVASSLTLPAGAFLTKTHTYADYLGLRLDPKRKKAQTDREAKARTAHFLSGEVPLSDLSSLASSLESRLEKCLPKGLIADPSYFHHHRGSWGSRGTSLDAARSNSYAFIGGTLPSILKHLPSVHRAFWSSHSYFSIPASFLPYMKGLKKHEPAVHAFLLAIQRKSKPKKSPVPA